MAGAALASQAEIADRDHAAGIATPVAIGEGVELLDIADRLAGLLLDPVAQARLQRAVHQLERSRRQRPAADRQDARPLFAHRHQHGDEVDGDGFGEMRRGGDGHAGKVPEPPPASSAARPVGATRLRRRYLAQT